jgi:hypothetical protein
LAKVRQIEFDFVRDQKGTKKHLKVQSFWQKLVLSLLLLGREEASEKFLLNISHGHFLEKFWQPFEGLKQVLITVHKEADIHFLTRASGSRTNIL